MRVWSGNGHPTLLGRGGAVLMTRARRIVLATSLVTAGGFYAKYLSYDKVMREANNEWLSLALFAGFVGVAAFIWLGRKK